MYFLFQQWIYLLLINIYLNLFQAALKYLKDTEVNISNILIIAGDFNIRDSSWDPSFPHHSIYCDLLNDIADSMDLFMSKATNCVPTRYFGQPKQLKLSNRPNVSLSKFIRTQQSYNPPRIEIVIRSCSTHC